MAWPPFRASLRHARRRYLRPSASGVEIDCVGTAGICAPVAHQGVGRNRSSSPCLREQSLRRRLGGGKRREAPTFDPCSTTEETPPAAPLPVAHGYGPEALRRCLTAALPIRLHPSTDDVQAMPRSLACCIVPRRIGRPSRTSDGPKLRAATARRSISGRRTDERSRKADARYPSPPTRCSE